MAYYEHKDAPLEHFFNIVPRDNEYYDTVPEAIPLNVIKDNGVTVEEGFNLSSTKLSSDTEGIVRKQYNNHGYSGITFDLQVLFNNYDDISSFNRSIGDAHYNELSRDMSWADYGDGEVCEYDFHYSYIFDGKEFFTYPDLINHFITNMIPINVVTMAVDVPDGVYLITDVKDKKQTSEGASIWSITFESYLPATIINFTEQTTGVKKALKKYKKAKAKAAAKKTVKGKVVTAAETINKEITAKVDKSIKKTVKELAWQDCKLSEIQYSKTKKTTACVKYMQKVLYKQGFMKKDEINGWYDKTTAKAVKEFQKKYKKKYNLTPNGTVDKATLKALKKV